jgi:hypothetical protein
MKKFIRQNATKAPAADIAIDFGAASVKVARVFEPEVYRLRVKTASVFTRTTATFCCPRSCRSGERRTR